MMGHIYKRGNIYWIKYSHNGRFLYESSKSRLKSVASELLKKREGEVQKGQIPGIHFDRVTFDELAEDFLRDYRINQRKSLVRAERSAGHLKRYFEGYRVPEITSPKIEAYIEKRMEWSCNECRKKFDAQDECPFCGSDDLKQGAANATINRELSALKRMLNIGARQTPPKVDRVPFIPMLKENNIRKGFFEHAEFVVLRNAIPEHLKGFVTFAYKTGWRLSEMAGLTWNQVDRNQGIVSLEVGETKNDDARTVYLDEELQEIFHKQWENRKNLLPYVFLNEKDTDKVKRFDKSWKTACKNAKIGNRLFHDFRRTAVRNMVRAGIPEGVAMKISGHKTRSVFERYNIVNDADLKLAAKKQAEYFEGVTKKVTIVNIHKKGANHRHG
jgi:integrase